MVEKHQYNSDQVLFYPLVKRNVFDRIMDYLDNNKDELESQASGMNAQLVNDLNKYFERIIELEQSKGIQMRLPFDFILK